MNKVFLLFAIISVLLAVFCTPFTAFAEVKKETYVLLPQNQTINHDYFAAGDTVTLLGTVNGDVYIAGGNVIVEGTVNGDLLVAGGNLTIKGKVRDDIRAAGGQIVILGEVGRNITTVGGSITIANSADIQGSLTAAAGNLAILTPIGKDANFGGGQVTIANIVNGNVQARVGQLTLTPNAKVLGNLTYWSDTSAQINSGAQITGKTTHNIPPQSTKSVNKTTQHPQSFASISFIFNIFSFLSALVIGLLLTTFMPVYSYRTANLILQKPLQTLGLGFLSMVLAPFLFLLLLITIIGIPLDLILLAGFLIFIYIAKIMVGIAIGIKVTALFNKKIALAWTFLLGIFLYYLITMIPLVGFIFWAIAGLMGLGALFLERKYVYTELRKKGIL